MPKKRVGVSLRKPSSPQPAPETVPESIPAPSEAVEAVSSETLVESAASAVAMSAVAMSADPAPSERPSDIVALREAAAEPAPAEKKAIEAFVNGATAAFEKATAELPAAIPAMIPAARLAELLQRGVDGYRELVLYLPEKLAQRLSLHCLEHNLDMSRLIASAIEQHLNGPSEAAPIEARRAEDAPVNEGLLSLAARVLMGELAAWARTVWARRRASTGSAAAA
ncbi:MAG TPA: hypothetical protein VMG12_08295 [Polyangiaceae bacterium]|nr:hypothetical protein [Polyangiaceae bacterium]